MSRKHLSLKKRITEKLKGRQPKDVRIAVIGVGYVGLPLAVRLAKKRFQVIGVDINRKVLTRLKEGKSTVEGVTNDQVRDVVERGTLQPLLVRKEASETSLRAVRSLVGVEVFIICVHTPLHERKRRQPDVVWIRKCADLIRRVCEVETVSNQLPRERLLVLESTTYPGTTRDILEPLLHDFAKDNRQWHLAYSPERTSPGLRLGRVDNNLGPDPFKIARVVGARSATARATAIALYRTVFARVEPVDNLAAAEMIKLVENTFRFVSIGFANELARIAKSFGLNVWEVIRIAKTKGFGLDLCFPGLIGGHCIPIDPYYLLWAAGNRRQIATFVNVAERAHMSMRREALGLIRRLLKQNNKVVESSSILFFGVAYKGNVSDTRESSAIELMKALYSYGAEISFWDPIRGNHTVQRPLHLLFSNAARKRLPDRLSHRLKGCENGKNGRCYLKPRELSGTWEEVQHRVLGPKFDCVVIATDHNVFKSAYSDLILAENGPPVADLRNALDAWIRTEKFPKRVGAQLRRKLEDRRRYMLLGVD